jgi:nuclear GTP-binding protein
VQKKVREHYKKQRRDAKRKKAQGIRPRKPKDPGVPASWPFKQELQQEMELHRQHTKALNQARRARSSQQQQHAQPHDGQDGLHEESESLAELSRQAQRRADAYAAVERAAAGSRNKSGSAATRAYFKEFRKVVQSADIVLHVLDARDPSACRCEDVERYVQRNNPDRRVVLVLNKADLVPREALQQWLARLREEAPAVAFKAAISKSGDSKPSHGGSNRPTESLKSEECLGVQTLLQLLKNFARKQGGTGKLIAGVVGLPNVGKSSLINSMKLSKAVHTAAEPGSTKTMQHVNIDSSISLLDSPGVVTSSPNEGEAAAALRNAHAIDSLEDPITPVRYAFLCAFHFSEMVIRVNCII